MLQKVFFESVEADFEQVFADNFFQLRLHFSELVEVCLVYEHRFHVLLELLEKNLPEFDDFLLDRFNFLQFFVLFKQINVCKRKHAISVQVVDVEETGVCL